MRCWRSKILSLGANGRSRAGGRLIDAPDLAQRYIDDLTKGAPLTRRLKVVVACGNGTAGIFAPQVLGNLGCDVVLLDCELDYTFPNYNPNPEDLKMLSAASKAVAQHEADLALCFDGDGDRCGVIDNEGKAIFADKVGVLLARHFAAKVGDALFIADVKSTGLLIQSGAQIIGRAVRILEDGPFLHEAAYGGEGSARWLREIGPLFFPAAAWPGL